MTRYPRLIQTCCLPLILAAVLGFSAQIAPAQSPPAPQPTESDELALDQSKLTDRYGRVEQLILRMAEYDQASNPRRSILLKNAFTLAKDRDIQLQMEAASRMLQQRKLQRALDEQEQVRRDMQSLLELLLSENRADRLKDEQARIRDYIREIERLERMQRSVQARTEGGVEAEQLQREQNQVAEAARKLHDTIEETELAENPLEAGKAAEAQPGASGDDKQPPQNGSADAESQTGRGEAGDDREPAKGNRNGQDPRDTAPSGARGNPLRSKPDAEKPDSENKFRAPKDKSDDKSDESDKSDQPAPSGESADGASPESNEGPESNEDPSTESKGSSPGEQGTPESGAKPQSVPSPSEQSPSTPGPAVPGGAPAPAGGESGGGDDATPPQQQDFPGLKRVQEAEQKMRDAEQKLAKAKRKGAIEDQREATKKLAEAKAELEKILRQMREEEIERVLASLEVRFRKMLEMQLRVYEDTLRVARISAEDRDRFMEIEAGKLSFQERRIVVEADKCLTVLREEGSSVAFPESTQQMRDDMQQVTDLLAEANVGRLTQGIEEDIIESLEEMIGALEQAQADQEQRKQDAPSMPAAAPGDLPLVDALAELRMLKALQIRINRRTSRYATMLEDAEDPVGKPTDDKLLNAVRELAERQQRLQEITRDISIGKNN